MNIKQIAESMEKYDVIFWGNVVDVVNNNSLDKQQTKQLFKELNTLGVRISNKAKHFVYSVCFDN